MNIAGRIELDIHIPQLKKSYKHQFYVLDEKYNNKVLLGRDFMKKMGTVAFDFKTGRIRIGNKWISSAQLREEKGVRVRGKVTLPARSESVVTLKCDERSAFLQADFEPKKLIGLKGAFISRARVIPNAIGEINVTVLNVNTEDIVIPTRTRFGDLLRPHEICSVLTSTDSRKEEPKKNALEEVVLGESLTEDQRHILMETLKKHENVFASNPRKPNLVNHAQHVIDTGNSQPVYIKPRRIPPAWNDEVNTQVKEMLDNEVIRPSNSPWNSPILMVKKRDNSTRFVCDFRGLNDITKKDTYPLPRIDDVIDKMGGVKYWTKVDAAAAYWSIPLAERDREKAAFSVPNGKFEFNVTAFGLCNTGASYQRMIDISLSGL